ncbi:hypothetical protein JCM9279_002559 [Rhodotorula babjevae]
MARSRPLRHKLPSSRSASPSSSSASDSSAAGDASSNSPSPRPSSRAARQVLYRSLDKGRRYDSDDSASEADPPARRAPPAQRGATKSAVLYLAIGVGILGVCVLGGWLWRSSQDDSLSTTTSTTTTSTATVSAAAAPSTTLEPLTSLADAPASSSPTASPSTSSEDDIHAQSMPQVDDEASKSKTAAVSSATSGAKPSGTGSAAASSGTWSGKATFYQQRGVAGNCGKVNPESAMICALQTKLYADGKNCGRMIRLTRSDNGESIEVEVADQCPSCVEEGYVDLSEGVYDKLGTRDEGWFDMSWYFID